MHAHALGYEHAIVLVPMEVLNPSESFLTIPEDVSVVVKIVHLIFPFIKTHSNVLCGPRSRHVTP